MPTLAALPDGDSLSATQLQELLRLTPGSLIIRCAQPQVGARHTLVIARRGTARGSNLGTLRWVIERSLGCLHQFNRRRTRYEHAVECEEQPARAIKPATTAVTKQVRTTRLTLPV